MTDSLELGSIVEVHAAQRPERADAAANRQLILETAQVLFADRGPAEVTMADIAAEAGVGKGTLYRRFSSKADLALALMHDQMTGFQEATLAELRRAGLAGEPFLDQLEGFLASLVVFTARHLPLLCIVQVEGLSLEEDAHLRPYFWQHQTVAGLLQRAIRAAELSPQVDVEYTADALLAPLRVEVFRLQRERRGFSLDRISSGLQTLVRGLRAL